MCTCQNNNNYSVDAYSVHLSLSVLTMCLREVYTYNSGNSCIVQITCVESDVRQKVVFVNNYMIMEYIVIWNVYIISIVFAVVINAGHGVRAGIGVFDTRFSSTRRTFRHVRFLLAIQ